MIHAFCVHERKWTLISAYQNPDVNPHDLFIYAANHAGKAIVANGWSNAALMTLVLVDDLAELPDDMAETFTNLIANADMRRLPKPWLN